jgi:Putative papain-like cysteine peptidase (DUF1796)
MNYEEPQETLDPKIYDVIVSIGNKCPTAMVLKEMSLYGHSYPFDSIPTTPSLVLKYLQDQGEFYPCKNAERTEDGVWFGHFDLDSGYATTLKTFRRRFQRLFTALQERKRILFVYTSEADMYNEMGNRYLNNFEELVKIQKYIETTYKYSDFTILAIHTNKTYESTQCIRNFTIHVDDSYLSDDMSTHIPEICDIYRKKLKELLAKILA